MWNSLADLSICERRSSHASSANTCSKCRWTSWVLFNRISFSRRFCMSWSIHRCFACGSFLSFFLLDYRLDGTEWIGTSIYLRYFYALQKVTVAEATNEAMRLQTEKKKNTNKVYIVAKYDRIWRFVIVIIPYRIGTLSQLHVSYSVLWCSLHVYIV